VVFFVAVLGFASIGNSQAGIFLLLLLLVGIIALAIWLDRRSAHRDALAEAFGRRDQPGPLPTAAQAYLSTLDGALRLPPEIRTEINAELSDHLADSIAAIEAEGLDRDRATREALARLGRPEELARQLRQAHQTTRRLLAGAAGGVFQAGIGAIWGYIFGIAIFFLIVIVASTALKPPLDFLAARLSQLQIDQQALATTSAMGAAVAWVAAFVAGRRSVQALMRSSRRTAAQVGRWWALGGFAALAWFVTFVVTAQQSWLVVPLVLMVPVAFAAGVLFRTEGELPFARSRVPAILAVAIAVILPVAIFAGASMGTSGSSQDWGTDYAKESIAFDRVAPAWDGDAIVSSGGGTLNVPVIDRTWSVLDPAGLAGFRDLRFEAWRAVQFSSAPDWLEDYIPAPGYSAPFAIQPAVVSGDSLSVRFDMSHVRTSRWAIFLTGIGPDGVRYRLGLPDSVPTAFSGTVWDWLTASE
jgi:hypothetical protein